MDKKRIFYFIKLILIQVYTKSRYKKQKFGFQSSECRCFKNCRSRRSGLQFGNLNGGQSQELQPKTVFEIRLIILDIDEITQIQELIATSFIQLRINCQNTFGCALMDIFVSI